MKFAGIIAEYDPFHNGHAWQLAQAKALGAERVAVAMSCSLVQRGALPLLPEAVRTRSALTCGADLVFALPAPCACAGAEAFARAGVALLAAAECDGLVFGAETPDAALLMEAAERNHATLIRDGYEMEVTDRVPAVGGQIATLHTPNGVYEQVPIAKFGEHQAHNALAALAAAEAVIPVNGPLNGDLVGQALQGVKVPGRIEQIRTSPTIILDGGHNVNAAEALRKAIEESYDFTQLVGVVAMMGDKQVEEYLGVLEPILSQVVVTENSWRDRVMPAEELEKIGLHRVHQGEFFHEFVTTCPQQEQVLAALDREGILGGLPVEGGLLWCATEVVTRSEMDRAVSMIKEVLGA